MADQDHLLAETGMLPVSEHLRLLSCQFLANASQEHHPSHQVIKIPTGLRKGRKEVVHTLQSRFQHEVEPFLKDGVLPSADYKKTIASIHTSIVASNRRSNKSKLLGTAPPEISPLEGTLPRRSRTTLSQLRSKYCNKLKDYQCRIGTFPNDLCPDCQGAAHSVDHIFTCPSSPTTLSLRDLWKQPRESIDFLRTLSSFDDLPINPPLPPPPPEPPPRAPLTRVPARAAPD